MKITSMHYKYLISSVKSVISSGLLAAQKILEYQRLKTYWEVGQRIRESVDRSGGVLVLGEKLYQQISNDLKEESGLDLGADTVGRMVQYNKNYPQFPENTTLTFTHYIALQRIKEPAKRNRLEKKAIKNNMSVLDIKDAIFNMNTVNDPVSAEEQKAITFDRGEPFVYATIVNIDLNGERKICIDCGFKINVDIPKNNLYKPKQSRIIRSVKNDGVYRVVKAKGRAMEQYTYWASVVRVVDGDTMDVRIDVGFGIHLNERLRLNGIDAPEINTQAGKISWNFLKKQLAECPGIVIRTKKAGMYGRWLADVFILPKCDDPFKIASEGKYLNQLLLDEGMAKVY